MLTWVIMIAFGALAGGLTNTVAIWMLFHPYEPLRIGRWTLPFFQGAVPKNQARLAAAIGRTVGGRLLTEDDLARSFARPEFRGAFDERLQRVLDEVLERERGSLRELIPETARPQVEAMLDEVVEHGLDRLAEYLASEEFERAVADRAENLVASVEDEPIGSVLTPSREEAITDAIGEWLSGAVESDDFRATLDDYVERAAHRLLEPERTFEEVLPLGLVASVEQAIQSYLPLAIERLGGLLEDEDTRERFESTLHDLFHRFLRDLKFHQRVVARLVVTEETVDRVLDTIEKEGAERLGELLQDPSVQKAMARGINDAIVDFLRRPVRSVLGEPDSETVVQARETIVTWVIDLARDPATHAFVTEKLGRGLEKAAGRTWGDLLDRVPSEKVTRSLVAAARSDTATRLSRTVAENIRDGLLDRRIGTPASWLPPGAPDRIENALSDPLWEWLQTQVPDVVERIDVASRVEAKVLDFPTARMEDLVRRVTERELRLIVKLGYLLGAIIGTASAAVSHLLG